LKINKLPDVHIVDRYLNTIHYFDVENDMKGLDYFIPEKDNVEINTLPENFKNGYILFAIGAQHFTKKLPVEKIVSICKKINFPLIISGGKEDFETGEIIKNQVGETILNACGKFNLNQSASLVKQAKFVISHDTGLMHIASAFKKDIISVWGNTVPVFGMYPYLSGENSIIVENNNLKCRPCSKIGFKKCPKKHFKCMNDIDESQIIKQVNKLIL
jgi:heptosyltransferase-2